MKANDLELVNEGFKLIQGSPDVLNLGFEILLMFIEDIKREPHLYNRLIKHYRRIPSMTSKPNLDEIKRQHTLFVEKLLNYKISTVPARRFGYITERLITYFKNNPDRNDTQTVPQNG
jgi:hypothetical protein